MVIIKKTKKSTNAEDARKKWSLYTVSVKASNRDTKEMRGEIPQKTKNTTTIWTIYTFPGDKKKY
jgi:hypothetical protein